MTTEEFLEATARSAVLQPGQRALLGDFLAESDLVKFARHVPTLADSDRMLGAAERFVDETAIREQLPAEEHRAAG
jgi:ATP phosphoribosyltransferase regulatory subunit HisZ